MFVVFLYFSASEHRPAWRCRTEGSVDLACDDQATIYVVVGELNTENMKQKDSHLLVAGHIACVFHKCL